MPAKRSSKAIRNWAIALFALLLIDLFVYYRWFYEAHSRFDKYIEDAAKRYGLEPALIKAVVWRESKFDPAARGSAGEIGLMQIREEAALEWAEAEKLHSFRHEDILDPRKNIMAGSFYLSKLLKRYTKTDNPVPYALADYNAGRSHVLRWNKGPAATNSAAFLAQMDYPGTKDYAIAVQKRRDYYRQRFR